jgi:hypothetical protein
MQTDPLGLSAGDLNFYRYTGNDPHNRTDPSGLTSALEYVHLIAENLQMIGDVTAIGICICQLFGAAADGLDGVQTSNPESCVGNLLGPAVPVPGLFGGAANSAINIVSPDGPYGLGGLSAACGK